ncbi:MAG: hypothetical protein WC328_05155 [Kiritimatiellia bacterium]
MTPVKSTRLRVFAVALLAAVCAALRAGAAQPAWRATDSGFELALTQGAVTCDARGRLTLRAGDQPALELAFFLWHGDYQYETLAGGRPEGAALQADGVLRLTGLWGARAGVPPVRYTLDLAPKDDGAEVRLALVKTGELRLTDGVWLTLATQVRGPEETRRIYLMPTADAPLGKAVEGLFKELYIGCEGGTACRLRGDGVRHLRSRVSAGRHGCEIKLTRQRDVATGETLCAALSLGFAPMPAIVRPAVTSRGALALTAQAPRTVPLYGTCELDVALSGTWDNPYDPDDIALDAQVVTASGRRYTLPGFFMVRHTALPDTESELMLSENAGQWKVRLAATEPGPMRITLTARDRSGTRVFALPQPVDVTDDRRAKGFVRVSRADPRYLAYDNGEGYVPIGHNVPICRGSNGMTVRQILEKMAAHGENWNRWWMSRSGLGIEWEPQLGWYRQDAAAKLDGLLEDAGRLGMTYMLCMDTHQDFRQEGWKANPYNAAQGGPCGTAGAWFTNETAKAFYRRRLRYTVARWAYSPQVMCWEFGNEFEGWADATQEAILAWHREMAPLLAALDPYDHLISTSWWSKTGPEACWQIPEMDVVQTHSYANNDLNTALEARAFCRKQWDDFEKPHLFAEFGIRSHNFKPDDDPDGRAIHNTSWASLASGACGAAMPWWHENYIEPKNLYFHFRALRRFVTGLPFGTERWSPVEVRSPGTRSAPARPSQRDVVALTRAGFRRAGADRFEVRPDGTVAPADELLALLHGGGHRDLVRPPTFEVTYPADGTFGLHVEKVSHGGHLKVFVDDVPVLDRELPCGEGHGVSWRYIEQWKLWESVYNETVTVPVKAGRRRIRVENHGRDWVAVSRYLFSGCRATEIHAVNCYALAAERTAIVWIQNGDSTWVNHARHAGEIRPFPAAAYTLTAMPDGEYEVTWWETWQGAELRRERVTAAGGLLTLRPGAVATDTAAVVRRLE